MIHDDILDFLRDAQYRIGELTSEIDSDLNIGEIELPATKHQMRLELMTFMRVLYDINHAFTDDNYTFILNKVTPVTYNSSWTELMILSEIEYLRVYTGMSEMPLISFPPYWTEVINEESISTGNEGNPSVSFPVGTEGQMLMYNSGGNIGAVDISPYGGMIDNETITAYFAGRD
jgi:hypothetical protein